MITIAYGMTGKQVRDALLANYNEIENNSLGASEAIITEVTTSQTVANFMTSINTKFTQLALRICKESPAHTEVSPTTEDIATVLNSNFTLFDGYSDDFLTDGVPFWLDVKQKTIPPKGAANILAQQDSWKLGYYTGEDVLYLSADNGLTWPYSIAFASGCDKIRTVHVFKNGNVFIGIRENKIFYSNTLLSTLSEITCKDIDGENLAFHEPVNASYPGSYFSSFRGNSFVKDGVEVFVFGNYPHHADYGAAPILMYRIRDDAADCKVIYKFGQNPVERDNGGAEGAAEGNLLGDVSNEVFCKHFHYCNYDYYHDELWVQTGDNTTPAEIKFMKSPYDVGNDTWDWTVYNMSALSGYFRAVALDFYNNGISCIWGSDANKKIYKVPYAQLTTALTNHTAKFTMNQNILGMSPYGEKMFAIGGPEVPGEIAVSVDYGETWSIVTTPYLNIIGALTTKMICRLWDIDTDGYALIHRSQIVPLYAKESYLLKIKSKPVH
jgi:hypothetical protein